jgi:hypothetical protein
MPRAGRIATWLDVVAVAHTRDTRVRLYVHRLLQADNEVSPKPKDQCPYGITIKGRWLHSSNGRLTVLKGRNAVERFIRLTGVSSYEAGEPAQLDVDCGTTAHCLVIGQNRALHGCA